jgi:hypothetical protein
MDVVEVALLANDTLRVLSDFTMEVTAYTGLLSAHPSSDK